MLIKFKNKMTMALQKMIDDGARLGGLPSHIEVSPKEAGEIFIEIHTLTPTPIGYLIQTKDGISCKLIFNAKEISDLEMQGYVNNWRSGEWKVEYKKIPVHVVNPTPVTQHLHS